MTDRLNELAKALADASDRLNGTNHRDDQRLMEEVATRIQARVDDYDAAYAALEAYGVSKASEGAVKVDIAPSPPVGAGDELMDALTAARRHMEGVTGINDRFLGHQVASPSYSNGLDGHKED